MMQIVYFSQKSQLWREFAALNGRVEFITPSPAKADSLRLQLGGANLSSDVVTIAKFTANLVQKLWGQGEGPQVKRKADLLLIFGIMKNKYFSELGFEQFIQAYNLFSDLRSFTLNEEALSSVLEEQPQEIRQALTLFWKLLEVCGYCDEHGTYHLVAEALRATEENQDLKKTYIFWGFQHLNGQQVDLLKALSIRYQVIIPFPLALKDKLKKSDWISWLIEHKVQETSLPEVAMMPQARWMKVNSREMALHLKSIVQEGDQVVLGVSKLSPLHADFVPSRKVRFKIPHQLLQSEIKELAANLKSEIALDVSLPEFSKLLEQKRAEILSKGSKVSFKELKALELYQDAVGQIEELTEEEVQVDSFFLKLLFEVVSLNQPRTSFIPLNSEELNIDLKDMSSLEELERERRIILCIDERFEDIQGGLGQNYPEPIQKALASLGPVKRNELELLFKQWDFHGLFSEAQVMVLMSENTLKHSLVWKRLFNEIKLESAQGPELARGHKLIDHFKTLEKKAFNGHYSATKLQSFLDCPRKFYFSYVDKVFPTIGLEQDFDSLTAGTISHKIIEIFHKQKVTKENLPALTRKIMQEFIEQNKLTLSPETYFQRELIFNHRALNGIEYLEKLKEALGADIEWRLEEEFEFTTSYKLKGKIDCLGITSDSIILLDFKSTKSSASSNAEIEGLESLQLWAYAQGSALALPDFKQKSVIMGFVSLDKPSESNLLVSSGDILAKIKEKKFTRQASFSRDFNEIFTEAVEKMSGLALAIESEKNFPALPRKPKACHFCELNKVCVKGELGE